MTKLKPEEIIVKAKQEYNPIKSYCLFSGGKDSSSVAFSCKDYYDELVFIDTGTGLPGTIDHVKEFANFIDKPIKILQHEYNIFPYLVLGGTGPDGVEYKPLGFPGPKQHTIAYHRLKDRLVQKLIKDTKSELNAKKTNNIMFLTGLRRAESVRRKNREPIDKKGSAVFVNPLIDWENKEVDNYVKDNNFPISDVYALLHRSGECQCGAFASKGEREMIKDLYPQWFENNIAWLEIEAEKRGLKYTKWGYKYIPIAYRKFAIKEQEENSNLCSSCEFKNE